MENILENSLLFDFYGELLTEKQKKIFSLYIEEDFSLSEIAVKFDVTRQSVYDTIKTAQNLLEEYEQKLGLVKKYTEHKKGLKEVLEMLDKEQDLEIVKENIIRLIEE
ncbi:MAG TPA: hypothetical protein DCP90_07090 [Clostridiales bacterium]|nr:MAG: hypothetical protein A2Y22_02370 [Clostridiales bacterium GWD2_32_59]HAN10361.1 hypothetical protein [Clostridiales bacterium]